MNKYTIVLSKKAKKQLDKLSDYLAQPIISAIAGLEENPRPIGCIKLTDREGYRIRVGDYRVIYKIFDDTLVVDVIDLGHRREIYG
jgi:mRNA interferase RelE/StbE